MTDMDKMARELLAAEHSKIGNTFRAEDIRKGRLNADEHLAFNAVRTALLTAPPGYVLVPVEAGEKEIETMAYAIPASVPSIDAAKVIARRVRDILVSSINR